MFDFVGIFVIYFAAVETKVSRDRRASPRQPPQANLCLSTLANPSRANGRDFQRKIAKEIQSRTCRPGTNQGEAGTSKRTVWCVKERTRQEWQNPGVRLDRLGRYVIQFVVLIVGLFEVDFTVAMNVHSQIFSALSSPCVQPRHRGVGVVYASPLSRVMSLHQSVTDATSQRQTHGIQSASLTYGGLQIAASILYRWCCSLELKG